MRGRTCPSMLWTLASMELTQLLIRARSALVRCSMPGRTCEFSSPKLAMQRINFPSSLRVRYCSRMAAPALRVIQSGRFIFAGHQQPKSAPATSFFLHVEKPESRWFTMHHNGWSGGANHHGCIARRAIEENGKEVRLFACGTGGVGSAVVNAR